MSNLIRCVEKSFHTFQMKRVIIILLLLGCFDFSGIAQSTVDGRDGDTPLHLSKPKYPMPYGVPSVDSISQLLQRIHDYLDAVTPVAVVDVATGKPVNGMPAADIETQFAKADFRLVSYEWGVTYAAMLHAAKATGNPVFADYTKKRIAFITQLADTYRKKLTVSPDFKTPVNTVLKPHALDDAGAMCAAMIKSSVLGYNTNTRPLTDNFIRFISTQQSRLDDGTLSRNRPYNNTVWLDDLFMSIPALAQMGALTGEQRYFDDAVRQVLLFSARLFHQQKGIYAHGWVQHLQPQPVFHWARANGWAMMAMAELLDVLPVTHAGYPAVLQQFQLQVAGIVALQSGRGLWHQLLDRNDSYLETSASAIYTYAIAKGINRGWIKLEAYVAPVVLAWNALSQQVNAKGQVTGTCVGTGMGFDAAFYYYRPVSNYAAHGYGPMILAGAEMITMLNNNALKLNEGAVAPVNTQ